MHARAAWRLKRLGFERVYRYAPGKADWLAAGLPTQGPGSQTLRAGAVARRDVPTCHLDERLGEVRDRVKAAGWDACVVVNTERVVLGLLRARELDRDPALRIEQAMRPGPSTFRPYIAIEKLLEVMTDHGQDNLPITTSDGRLVGLVTRAGATGAAMLDA